MNHPHKSLFLLAVGGFLFSLLSWYLWIEANQDNEPAIFGVVTQVGTSSIIVTNRRQEMTEVTLTASTTIWQNKEVVSGEVIVPGNFVQVVGTHESDVRMTADMIRLLKRPKEADKYE